MNGSVSSDQARSALAVVPADDRGVWLRMAMAIKHGLGDAGFGVWDEWSWSSEGYRQRDAFAVFRLIRPGAR
jgi:putative DNA primase/helicase